MIKTIYGTYRMADKSPSEILGKKYADYKKAGFTEIIDTPIPEHFYTTELVPGIKKLSRLIIGKYDDKYINRAKYESNIATVGVEFGIEIFKTLEDVKIWIRANTNLKEKTPGVFIFSGAIVDPVSKKTIPESLFTII